MTTPRRAPHVPPAGTASPLPLWGALCFFASGAAGLLYEVVWSKQLAYLLGNSLQAVATVVAAFLCGLAIGALLLGVPLARRGQGPRVYAVLELAVALLGLLSLPVLRGMDPIVGQLYRSLGGEGVAFGLARFGLLFALLIPPAALMGATLPVLVAHFERDLVGPALARLYALNTFGAVVGSVAGGFALLPGLGLTGTTWVAAALNGLVGLVAFRAAGSRPAVEPVAVAAPAPRPAAKPVAPPLALTDGMRRTLALLFGLSGFAALAFQIAWVRLFGLVIGTSVYSFSAVLGVYLLGLAIGSAAVGRWMKRGVSLAGFAWLQLTLAVVAALELHAFSRLPDWMYALAERSGARWEALFAGELWMVAVLLIVPCALLGAAFPVAARLLQRGDGGQATGFAYAVNTAGTIAGSLAAGFLLVPNWGVQGTHLAALVISAAIGLVALALARARHETRTSDLVAAAVAVVAVAALAGFAPRWDPSLMSAGPYRPVQAANLARYAQYVPGPGSTLWRATRTERVLYYREGINGSVLVGTDPEGRQRWLRVGGKIDASTDDMETQVLLGLLPAALADSGARTLVIGLGSGITLASALAGGAGPTEVVELEPGVVEASRFFHEPGANPLDDPRTRVLMGDARTHLLHGAGRFGMIVSEPSNPWIAGVNNLFTVDFYRRVKQRLEPQGVFCQWMQLYELTPETFASMVSSFLEVFPEGHVFSVWRSVDVLLIAAPGSRRLALERLETPVARRMLERAKIASPEQLAGYYSGPLSALRASAGAAPLNRDDRPIVEYRAPRDLVTVGRSALRGDSRVTAHVPFAEAPPEGALFASWPRERWFESRARLLAAQGDETRARATTRGAAAAGLGALSQRLNAEIDVSVRHQRGLERMEQAGQLMAAGREQEGRHALEQAAEADPSNGHPWLMLADRRRVAGDLAGAEAALARGRASGDPTVGADLAILTGLIAIDRKQPAEAVRHFAEAQRVSPKLPQGYVLEARTHLALGDQAAARAALRRGLKAIPGDPEISSTLAGVERMP